MIDLDLIRSLALEAQTRIVLLVIDGLGGLGKAAEARRGPALRRARVHGGRPRSAATGDRDPSHRARARGSPQEVRRMIEHVARTGAVLVKTDVFAVEALERGHEARA